MFAPKTDIKESLHISYSQINTYITCPLRFRLQYVQGLPPDFVPAALPLGSTLHECLALLYHTIRLTGEAPSLRELDDIFAERWQSRLSREGAPIKMKADETTESLMDQGQRLLAAYYQWRHGQGFPKPDSVVAVEEPLRVGLGEIDLVGVVDLILRDSQDPHVFHLVDHKSAAKRYDPLRIATDHQLTAYAYLVAESRFLPENAALTLGWEVVLRQKTPTVDVYRTTRTLADQRRFLQLLQTVLRAVEHEIFYPIHGWACVDCGYRSACPDLA